MIPADLISLLALLVSLASPDREDHHTMGFFGKKETKKSLKEKDVEKTSTLAGGAFVEVPPMEKAGDRPNEGDKIAERPEREHDAGIFSEHQPKSSNQVYDVEDPGKSFSKDEYSEEEHRAHQQQELTRQNHLNSLFNGHLMKWKLESEEGTSFIRVPAFFGGLALIVTSIVSLVLYPEVWNAASIVMFIGVIILSCFILILDGRFLCPNPLSARAHLRDVLTRNFNIFRYVWGRGLLYIVAGTLSVVQMQLINICSGSFMIVVGVIALCVGIHASRKFAALRSSLADESFLLLVFSNYDYDGDGYIEAYQFSRLVDDLGMELDDRYTLKAFNAIDMDSDRKISFEEFNHWWASGYIERGRKRRDAVEDDGYNRMT